MATRPWGRRGGRYALAALILAILGGSALSAATTWVYTSSSGHRFTAADAPSAPVAIVYGAQLEPDRIRPKPFLAGRLNVAVDLWQRGLVQAFLLSGDANGESGDEIAAMTRYLVEHGVPAERIIGDGYGRDSYDTCVRARDVYGVRRALLVSQGFHLPRAVTLCRSLGIDADGVEAGCVGCTALRTVRNLLREPGADLKAAADLARNRRPAVQSPPDPALTRLLTP